MDCPEHLQGHWSHTTELQNMDNECVLHGEFHIGGGPDVTMTANNISSADVNHQELQGQFKVSVQ